MCAASVKYRRSATIAHREMKKAPGWCWSFLPLKEDGVARSGKANCPYGISATRIEAGGHGSLTQSAADPSAGRCAGDF